MEMVLIESSLRRAGVTLRRRRSSSPSNLVGEGAGNADSDLKTASSALSLFGKQPPTRRLGKLAAL